MGGQAARLGAAAPRRSTALRGLSTCSDRDFSFPLIDRLRIICNTHYLDRDHGVKPQWVERPHPLSSSLLNICNSSPSSTKRSPQSTVSSPNGAQVRSCAVVAVLRQCGVAPSQEFLATAAQCVTRLCCSSADCASGYRRGAKTHVAIREDAERAALMGVPAA